MFSKKPVPQRFVGYYANWDIYAREYKPQNIPATLLTHILYAFANVRPESGEVYLSDAWADEQIHWEGDSWNDSGNNLYGCFKQLNLLKKQNRHLKVLLSIGGYSYSPNFAPMASDPRKRQEFADSAVKLLEDYGLDGLDVDWEYPENDKQAQDYVQLLKVTRERLDALAQSKQEDPSSYELTVASPCGPYNFPKFRVAEMDKYLSFWNLMAYDYTGPWESQTGHQANVFGKTKDDISTSRAIEFYHKKSGVRKDKLVIGIPLYGRSFTNTGDGPGNQYQGLGQGTWEKGTYDYKALPLPGAIVREDRKLIASWCYANGEFVTYDTRDTAIAKANWIKDEGLGGAMVWELSGDHLPDHPMSIVKAVSHALAQPNGLDGRLNHLRYNNSKWDNLRNGL